MLKAGLVVLFGALTITSASASVGKVTSVGKSSSDHYKVLLSDTVKGVAVSCGLYDASGKLLAANTWITDNLATQVLIRYSGDDVASAECTEN